MEDPGPDSASPSLTISMSFGKEPVLAQHPWDAHTTYLQGGDRGLVIRRSGGSYRTAFVEAFITGQGPALDGFYRGEGTTVEAAEDDAWNKFQRVAGCEQHEYEPRGYESGAGFCKHCNKFSINVFTGEELGQRCTVVAACENGAYNDFITLGEHEHRACSEHWGHGKSAFATAYWKDTITLYFSYPEACTLQERKRLKRLVVWCEDPWVTSHLRSLGMDGEDPISDFYEMLVNEA